MVMKVTSSDELRSRVQTTELPTDGLEPHSYWIEDVSGNRLDERIGWPLIFKYRLTMKSGLVEWSPYQPTFESHPAPPGTFLDPEVRPSSLPWVIEVYDLARFEVLMRSGALRDLRHTGSSGSEMVDNRKAPGA